MKLAKDEENSTRVTPCFEVFKENIYRLRIFYGLSKENYEVTMKTVENVIKKLKGEEVEEPIHEKTYSISLTEEQVRLLEKVMAEVRENYLLYLPFARSQILIFAVSLSEFYVNDLFRYIFEKNVNILKSEKKTITYEKLLSFKDLGEIYDYIVEKECYVMGYMSYEELSDYFHDRFQVDFSNSDVNQEDLIEVFAVRNLLIHNRGVVNRAFLRKVKKEKYELGASVSVDEGFLNTALSMISKQVSCIDSWAIDKF